jgi:glycosyltransferase involved in cell wall biosynthesis
MPLVSVIIPAHNPGSYLRDAIGSIHRQSFNDWELVVVDDNSSEDLSWVPKEFPRARLIRQAHGGVSVARNNGILSTSGELIAFMDQDDVWRPRKLERQVAALVADPAAAVCYCDMELIDAEGRRWGEARSVEARNGDVVTELDPASDDPEGRSPLHRSLAHFASRFVVPSTVMIRQSALSVSGLLDPFIPFSGDFDLLIKLGARHRVIRVRHADVLYRKHDNNFSDQYEVGRREVEALVARYEHHARSQGDRMLARVVGRLLRRPRSMYAAQAFDRARQSLHRREYSAVAAHLTRAMWFSPGFVLGSVKGWVRARCTSVS